MRLTVGAALSAVMAVLAAGSPAAAAAAPVLLFPGRSVLALAAFGDGIYAGTDGGLLVSRGGGGWTGVPGPLASARVNALLATPGRLYAGGDSAVLSSGDGTTWAATGLTGQQVDSLAASGPSVFAGTGTEQGGDGAVRRSQDGGATWVPAIAAPATIGLPGEAIQALLPTAQGPVLAGTAGGGMYASPDGAGRWSPSQRGLDNPWVTAIVDDGVELLAGTDDGLYRSGDGGASWSLAAFPISDPWVQALARAGRSVVAGTYDGALLVLNGSRWQVVAQGLPSVYSVLPYGGGYLAGTQDGLYCVSCDTATPPPRGAPAPVGGAARPGLAVAPTPPPPSGKPGGGASPPGIASTPGPRPAGAGGPWAAAVGAAILVVLAAIGALAWRRRRPPA